MENNKLVQEQFAKLPTELQKALGMVKWEEIVREIAKSNNLNEDGSENLERETMFILYGFESPEDYASNIVRELGIGAEVADVIAQEVDEKIFKVISEMIEKGTQKEGLAPASLIPEIPPKILPAIEPGEVAHEVARQEPAAPAPASAKLPPTTVPPVAPTVPKPQVPAPTSTYSGGIDPYREPIE